MNKTLYCLNCGGFGHLKKQCRSPTTSYGIFAIYIDNIFDTKEEYEEILKKLQEYFRTYATLQYADKIICSDFDKFMKIKKSLKVLIIMRKHTYGYVDFVRGHYNPNNYKQIYHMFTHMTPEEINYINNNSNNFDTIYRTIWRDFTDSKKYGDDKFYEAIRTEYRTSKLNFDTLRDSAMVKLDTYIKCSPCYQTPEWSLPKGKRMYKSNNNLVESNIECALREFSEETGLEKSQFTLFENLSPCMIEYHGSDGLHYRNVFYTSIINKQPQICNVSEVQRNEVGGIGLFDIDEVMSKKCGEHNVMSDFIISIMSGIIQYIV